MLKGHELQLPWEPAHHSLSALVPQTTLCLDLLFLSCSALRLFKILQTKAEVRFVGANLYERIFAFIGAVGRFGEASLTRLFLNSLTRLHTTPRPLFQNRRLTGYTSYSLVGTTPSYARVSVALL